MEQKFFHGSLDHNQLAQALAARFHRGNLAVRIFSEPNRSIVQIATSSRPLAGGRTALSVILQHVEDGVAVRVGQQDYLGVAASLGMSALAVFRSPLNLLGRLDDIAQDIEYLQLSEEVWRTIEEVSRSAAASTEISLRLRSQPCSYCSTPNPLGEPHCLACGAPLADIQPRTCLRCGFVVRKQETTCPNCRSQLK